MLERKHVVHYDNGMISFVRENAQEPEHIYPHDDLPSLFTRGWGSGYVGVPEGHSLFGVFKNNIPVKAHDGINYCGQQEIDGKVYWVIGFYTYGNNNTPSNCNEDYVVSETEMLYTQLKQL